MDLNNASHQPVWDKWAIYKWTIKVIYTMLLFFTVIKFQENEGDVL